MPFQRNLNFAGRDTTLQAINHSLVVDDRNIRRVAVCGMGGVGKTQIAIEFAYRNAGAYKLIWWLRAEDPSRLSDDFVALGDYLHLKEMADLDRSTLVEAIREHLEQSDKWLLIFDNAERPEDLNLYLPRFTRGHVLLTSRNLFWGEIADAIPVKTWERAGSVEFLNKVLSVSCGRVGDGLANDLGDLPLALAQAAAYINRTGIEIGEYRKLFIERRKELWDKEARLIGYAETVATTWSLALRQIKDTQPMSAVLLCLFAQMGSGSLTNFRALSKTLRPRFRDVLADPLRLADAIAPLRQYSLVDLNGDLLIIHPLVRSVVLDNQDSELIGASDEEVLATDLPPSANENEEILTPKATWELLQTAPKAVVDEIREIFGTLCLPNIQGNTTDHEAVLQFIKRLFATSILLEPSKQSELLREAASIAVSFQLPEKQQDWQLAYGRVRAMINHVLAILPHKTECLGRLASLPRRTVAAWILRDSQTSGDYLTRHNITQRYIEVIDSCSIGKLAWPILENIIRQEGVWSKTLLESIRIGKRDLKEDFEELYLMLRRKPFDEELAEYNRKEEEREKLTLLQERKNEEERERRLSEELRACQVDVDAPRYIPALSALNIIKKHLKAHLVELSELINLDVDMTSRLDDQQEDDLRAIFQRAKRILARHYPEICREVVIELYKMEDGREDYVRCARKLRELLKSACAIVEIDLETMGLNEEKCSKQVVIDPIDQINHLRKMANRLLLILIITLTFNGMLLWILLMMLTK